MTIAELLNLFDNRCTDSTSFFVYTVYDEDIDPDEYHEIPRHDLIENYGSREAYFAFGRTDEGLPFVEFAV